SAAHEFRRRRDPRHLHDLRLRRGHHIPGPPEFLGEVHDGLELRVDRHVYTSFPVSSSRCATVTSIAYSPGLPRRWSYFHSTRGSRSDFKPNASASPSHTAFWLAGRFSCGSRPPLGAIRTTVTTQGACTVRIPCPQAAM